MDLEKIVKKMIADAKVGAEDKVEGRIYFQWVCSDEEAKKGCEIANILLSEFKKIYPNCQVDKVDYAAPNQQHIIQISVNRSF
ncbi:hypothetical protein [Desulfotalea psychrophila]|uniref:hypothetical protein n=1 Tax=Desulfotalea psychrophila TaxID=84980 RepID=UPI0003172CCC|nr:hypothetical protein [Desulfotalea psychrophila]